MRLVMLLRALRMTVIAALAATATMSTSFASALARPEVPSCFIEPPDAQLAPVAVSAPPNVACTLLAKLLRASDETQLAWIPGVVLNKILGVSTDAFPDSAYAVRFVVTPQFNATFSGPDALTRFGSDDFGARVGSWWTVREIVSGAAGRLDDKAVIAAELALPASSVPSVAATATAVSVGTVGYFGVVAPAFGQPGGGVQFWFPAEPVRSTTTTLP